MLVDGGGLLPRELLWPAWIDLPTHSTGRTHHCILRIQATNDRLGVYRDTPREVVIYERSHVRMLHHQILEGVADITYHLL